MSRGAAPRSESGVHVHVNGKRRSGNGVAIGTLIAVAGLMLAAVGFFSTYVFVTKVELTAHTEKAAEIRNGLNTEQKLTDAAVKSLATDVREMKAEQSEIRVEQKVTNRNLNKLLRRSRITPASRDDIKFELEDEEP